MINSKIFSRREKMRNHRWLFHSQTHFYAHRVMISIESSYFHLNRILLLAIGLWPCHQSNLVRFQIILCFSILISCVIFQVFHIIFQIFVPLYKDLYTLLNIKGTNLNQFLELNNIFVIFNFDVCQNILL